MAEDPSSNVVQSRDKVTTKRKPAETVVVMGAEVERDQYTLHSRPDLSSFAINVCYISRITNNVANNQPQHHDLAPPSLGGEEWAGRVVCLPGRFCSFLQAGRVLQQPRPGYSPGLRLLRLRRGGNSENRPQLVQVSQALESFKLQFETFENLLLMNCSMLIFAAWRQ